VRKLKACVLRMARYSRTPISTYLSMPIAELFEWMEVIGEEIERENQAIEEARRMQKK